MSILQKYKYLEEAYPDMLKEIGMLIQKGKLSGRFEGVSLSDEEVDELRNARELCELKIIELWQHRDKPQFKALCATYFDISSQLSAEKDNEYCIYEDVKLIAFGYLGEHWHFVKQYFKSNDLIEKDRANWNQRLLFSTYKALRLLVVKESWTDLKEAVQLINQLKEEQGHFEDQYLNQVNEESRPYGAAELVSLYHFARGVEILGEYLIEGRPVEPEVQLQYHLNISGEYAQKSGNVSLVLLYQFFEAFAVKMVRNTIWYNTRGVNNWISKFNRYISSNEKSGVFELLYPQKHAIIGGQLLNPANRAIVINLPTSSGKTMIAEYRILQALNQFRELGGWVAYLVPTKALVNQVFIQLKKDLGSIGVMVEKASGAVELDGFEEYLVEEEGNRTEFDVLVTTYEKMNLLVRQGLGTTEQRPLVLSVVDEAHNIEDPQRGLMLELMLSTIKNDCVEANFLLMTPDIRNSMEIASWLAPERGDVINVELDWWQPNERVIGAIEVKGEKRTYDFYLNTLHTDKATYEIGEAIPLAHFEHGDHTKSVLSGSKTKIASTLASEFLSLDAPTIVLAYSSKETYRIAEHLFEKSSDNFPVDEDVDLLIKLVESEMGAEFPLARHLTRRIAVHSSALPDEIRFLIEDLMAQGKLQAMAATTTIAQGINFPVSSVIAGRYNYPYTSAMPVRDFWNLAGRVGRTGQDQMGWVGIAVRDDADLQEVTQFIQKASENLISQLVDAIDYAIEKGGNDFENWLFNDPRWSAVLQYISHLRRQTEHREMFLAQLEQKLQGTLGYRQLTPDRKTALQERIRRYAVAITPDDARRSDETGFSTISVRKMMGGLNEAGLTSGDWKSNQLFSAQNQSMSKLVGIMLRTDEIRKSISELNQKNKPLDHSSIARLMINWVNGENISSLSRIIYPDADLNDAVQKTSRALYSIVSNMATWGLAALQKMPNSGMEWDKLSETEKKQMANIPAYLHYGVNTDAGVLMRKNNVPRSIANSLGELYSESIKGEIFSHSSKEVVDWLEGQVSKTWEKARPAGSRLSGEEYKKIWRKLNGV